MDTSIFFVVDASYALEAERRIFEKNNFPNSVLDFSGFSLVETFTGLDGSIVVASSTDDDVTGILDVVPVSPSSAMFFLRSFDSVLLTLAIFCVADVRIMENNLCVLIVEFSLSVIF